MALLLWKAFMNSFRLATRCARLKPSAIRQILKVTASPDVISFAGGLPAPELFPLQDIGRAAEETLRDDGAAAMQYGPTEGYLPLREWVCAHLLATVKLQVSPDCVLITQGSQQGLDLVAKVLLDPGDRVLVENPSYVGALQAFGSYEAELVGIPSDEHGMRAEELRRVLKNSTPRPKFLYLIPNFHNPTGTSLSGGRRKEIVDLASAYGVPVIEDDPYEQMRYSGEPWPALAAMPGAPDRLYLGTASKILCPGLRIAWLVVPEKRGMGFPPMDSYHGLEARATSDSIYERLVSAKQASDLHTSSFAQRVVWRYVRQAGVFDAHVQRLRAAYACRRDAMLRALERHMPEGCRWTRPDRGIVYLGRSPPANRHPRTAHPVHGAKIGLCAGRTLLGWIGRAQHAPAQFQQRQ